MAEMTENIVSYMVEKKWNADRKMDRKLYLYRLAQQSKHDEDLSSKIGGMLIYNQVIEQLLEDIVILSIHFIKAEIFPEMISLDIELDKATFGKMIDYFKQFATIEPNREQILSYLSKHNSKRNQVVHDLFNIENLEQLCEELDEYAHMAEDLVSMLLDYDKAVCDNFRALAKRVDFTKYLN